MSGGVKISLIDYTEGEVLEKECADISECIPFLEGERNTWIHITGLQDRGLVDFLSAHLQWHSLLQEDILSPGRRPKLNDYEEHIYIAARMLRLNPKTQEIENGSVNIIFGERYLISFSAAAVGLFSPVREQFLKRESALLRRGPDYLAYLLMDCIVDHYFHVIERLDDRLQAMEKRIFHRTGEAILHKIQKIKREINLVRKRAWPMREVVRAFQRSESRLIRGKTRIFANGIHDYTVEAVEAVESLRDVADSIIEIHLSNVNQRTNQILTVLTIVATIFVPITFIASFYGMNFKHMPGLESAWGFPLTLASMVLIGIGMLGYFYKKRWL